MWRVLEKRERANQISPTTPYKLRITKNKLKLKSVLAGNLPVMVATIDVRREEHRYGRGSREKDVVVKVEEEVRQTRDAMKYTLDDQRVELDRYIRAHNKHKIKGSHCFERRLQRS